MTAVRIRPMSPSELTTITDPCAACGYPRLPAGMSGSSIASAEQSRSPSGRIGSRWVQAHRNQRRGRRRVAVADVDGSYQDLPVWAEEIADLWGMCGVAAHNGQGTAGYLTFTAGELVPEVGLPRMAGSTSGQLSADAAVILDVAICAHYQRQHMGRNLVRAAAAQLIKQDVGMVEVIASPVGPVRLHMPTRKDRNLDFPAITLLPMGFWLATGFRVVRPHPVAPVLRLDLAGTQRWLPDLAGAWQRFAELISQPAPPRPARLSDQQRTERLHESVPH